MWRWRLLGLAVTWLVAATSVAVLLRIPDRYEATARVYVDTQTLLKPLLSGLAVQPDLNQQVSMLARTLVTRPNIERLVRQADLEITVLSQRDKDRLVDQLMQDIKFASSGRDNVYSVSFRDGDRDYALRVVQTLVSMFVESGLGNKRRDTEAARKFIDEQIQAYEQRLEEAENLRKEFRLRNFEVASGNGPDHIGKMSQLSEELSKVRLELRVAEQSRNALKLELSGEEPVLFPDPTTSAAQERIPEIDARIEAHRKSLDDLLRRFTDEHPDVVGTRRVIAALEAQRREEIEMRRKAASARGGSHLSAATNPVFQQIKIALSDAESTVAALRARAGELQARLDQLRVQANRVPQVEAELAQLNRDYEVLRNSYQQLVSRRESANITGEVDSSASMAEFRIIDPPRTSPKPVSPNRALYAVISLLAAIGAGLAAAFAMCQLFPTFHTTRVLRHVGGRPVLGSISLRPEAVPARRQFLYRGAFAGGLITLFCLYGGWIGWMALNAGA